MAEVGEKRPVATDRYRVGCRPEFGDHAWREMQQEAQN